jgi:hypothetical protein
MSCEAWKSRGQRSVTHEAANPCSFNICCRTVSSGILWTRYNLSISLLKSIHFLVMVSWGVEVRSGSEHVCTCDTRSLKRIVGSSNAPFRCSWIVYLGWWEKDWAVGSSCCHNFEHLSVSAAGLRGLAWLKSASFDAESTGGSDRKLHFGLICARLLSYQPLFCFLTPLFESAELQVTTIVSFKIQRRVKLNFCIFRFRIHRRIDLLPCSLKVQNAARLQVYPAMLPHHTAYWVGPSPI